jgi:hypothetical protein
VAVPFTPAGGEPVMIEATAAGYLGDSVVVGQAAIAAVPPTPLFGPPTPRVPDFAVELYAAPAFAVELVVPPGFRGLLRVDLAFRDEVPIPAGQRAFPFTASPTGEVKGAGPAVLRKVPTGAYTARLADGSPVGGPTDPDGVALRWLRREDGCEVFVLGTRADFDRHRREAARHPADAPAAPDTGKRAGRGGRGGGHRGG